MPAIRKVSIELGSLTTRSALGWLIVGKVFTQVIEGFSNMLFYGIIRNGKMVGYCLIRQPFLSA